MPALSERFLGRRAATMTELRQFGAARGNFHQGAARACNGASEHFYEHPWCAKTHTAAPLLLPGAIRYFFGDDGVADGHNLMDQPPMQTFAVGGQFPLAGGFAAPGGQIPLAVLPGEVLLLAFLDAPTLVIIGRVVRAALPLHLPLEMADG